jgi:putative transposase
MPRLPRLHVAGGCYHVMLRGNHREDLFATSADRLALNEIVGEVLDRFGSRAFAFCWMTNHLHLLLQIADWPLGRMMQRIAMRYSRYRHKQLRTTGHLFERRYRAKLVEVDAYLAALLRYIHLNPVAAGIAVDPGDYAWSSHRAYLGLESFAWLNTDVGLGLFGTTTVDARASYAKWMAQAVYASEERLLEETHPEDARILGGDRFLATLPPPKSLTRASETLEQLAARTCTAHGVALDRVRSADRRRHLSSVRAEIASHAIDRRIATLTEVARYLGRDPSALSTLLDRHSKR